MTARRPLTRRRLAVSPPPAPPAVPGFLIRQACFASHAVRTGDNGGGLFPDPEAALVALLDRIGDRLGRPVTADDLPALLEAHRRRFTERGTPGR